MARPPGGGLEVGGRPAATSNISSSGLVAQWPNDLSHSGLMISRVAYFGRVPKMPMPRGNDGSSSSSRAVFFSHLA
jgi:hypothetical protein